MCKKLIYSVSFVLVLGVTASVMRADLVAYWPLDEGAGSVAHDAVGDHDGELVGGPTWISPGQVGAGALSFSGGNYVNCGTGVTAAPDMTVAFWMNANAHGYQRPIACSAGDYSESPGWIVMLRIDDPPGGVWFRINGTGGGWADGDVQVNETLYEANTWVHMLFTFDSVTREEKVYINGELRGTDTAAEGRSVANMVNDLRFGSDTGAGEPYTGMLDEVAIWDNALTAEEVLDVYTLGVLALDPRQASTPDPSHEATDVCRDVVLTWGPGEYAAAHDVYFGTSFEDVNDATKSDPEFKTTKTLGEETYAPGRLDFGTTYYWRIDEVNGPPDYTRFKGDVWWFKTEAYSYPVTNVTATADSNDPGKGPEKTLDLEGDLHSTDQYEMWLSTSGTGAWIEYAFDKVYKLDKMEVWNHNTEFESLLNFGVQNATIEYSSDGVDYEALGTTHNFNQAPGAADYAANTTIDLEGIAARYVKITVNSTFGGPQAGLSEVRFYYVPVSPRDPSPDPGATEVGPDVVLSWTPGREVATHELYLDTDPQAVAEGSVEPVVIAADGSCTASYSPPSLDLGRTYYWKVNEVNVAEDPTTWAGELWSFSTPAYLVVDDMSSYGDENVIGEPGGRIWYTWKDGEGWPAPPEPAYPGNGTGSVVDLNSVTIYETPQSLEYHYSSNGTNALGTTGKAYYSEATALVSDLAIGNDWTEYGVKALRLYFYGRPGNAAGQTEQMYVKLNGSKVVYDGDMNDITEPSWHEWSIPLADFGIDLQNVTEISIGFGDEDNTIPGGSGMVLFDDIRLYPSGCVLERRSAELARVDFEQDCVIDYKEVEVLAANWLAASAAPGTVPNGDFEELYKPGSVMITADLGGGWTEGVGPDAPMDNGTASYSDGTTGDWVDIPGWIGADPEGWVAGGGSYDRDTNFPNRQGAVARQIDTPDGQYYYLANGGEWGNPAGGLIVSESPVGVVEDGSYTLSMIATGAATPVVLELLAGGVPLTPSSSVDPNLSGDWQEFSRTYDSGSLAGFLGEPLTIRLGVGRDASGTQTRFDRVQLFHSPEPLPTDLLRLAGRRADLNDDGRIDFKDFAELSVHWLDEELWP